MTPEEKRKYAERYRREGYGRNADARYREKWADVVRARDRMRKRLKRRRDGGATRKGK